MLTYLIWETRPDVNGSPLAVGGGINNICTDLMNMWLNSWNQIHTWDCLSTLLVNVENFRQGVPINPSVMYFHICHFLFMFSREWLVKMRTINICFCYEGNIISPCCSIRVISSANFTYASPNAASSATASSMSSSVSTMYMFYWINFWNIWATSTVWLWIEVVVLIHICRKHVVVSIKYKFVSWESFPSSLCGDAIVHSLLFLKSRLKLDNILIFS